MKTFKKTKALGLLGTVSLMALSSGAPVIAQDNDADEIEEVIVTGFRASVQRSLEAKRKATNFTESIMATDIAEFPDTNLAEAMQRIPGVTITRDAGEGRQVSMRGLGPDFTKVTINGMDGLSVGQNTLGDVNNGRGFDFNIFASELFSRIDVHKSTSASMREGGIGGTVGLKSAKPFDYDGFAAAAGFEGAYNLDTKRKNPRATGLISNTWGEEFGILFSAAYAERSIEEHSFSTVRFTPERWYPENMGPNLDPAVAAQFLSGDSLWVPRGARQSVYGIETERLGLTGSAQWRPSDDFEMTLDGMYAKQDSVRNEFHMGTGNLWSGGGSPTSGVSVRAATIDPDSARIERARFTGVRSEGEGRRDPIENEFYQVVLSGIYQVSDNLEINGHLGQQESNFHQTQVGINFNTDTSVITNPGLTIDFATSDHVPAMLWNYDVTDPANLVLSRFRVRDWQKDIKNKSAELNAIYTSDQIDFSTGISYNKFSYASAELRMNSLQIPELGQNVADLGLGQLLPYDWGASLTGNETDRSVEHYWTSDVLADTAALGLTNYVAPPRANSAYMITEEAVGLYGQMDFRAELGDLPVRGNMGVRYVETNITAEGTLSGTPTVGKNSYSHVLPSMNVVVETSEDMLVRFGASRNLTRPSLGSLRLNGSFEVDEFSGEVSVSSGNPGLAPLVTDNVDLSFEWYFADESLISAGLFYKKLTGFSTTLEEEVLFSETGLDLPVADDQIVSWRRAVNDANESIGIKGIELIYQQDLSNLIFDGVGIITNYTYTDSKQDYINEVGSFTGNVTGLSSHSFNGTLYYETETWGSRISANYRSDYIASGGTYRGVWPFSSVKSTTFVDFNGFYNVTENIQVTLEALNLTNAAFDLYTGSDGWPYTYTRAGRTLMLGVRWTY